MLNEPCQLTHPPLNASSLYANWAARVSLEWKGHHVAAGYVWNGLLHQNRSKAVAGGIALAAIAALTHAAFPGFEADKSAISWAVYLGAVDDPSGALRRRAAEPPVLPPFDSGSARAAVLRWLPVKQVDDEAYADMQALNPPLTISLRRCEPCHAVSRLQCS